jgi:hypothetical protein
MDCAGHFILEIEEAFWGYSGRVPRRSQRLSQRRRLPTAALAAGQPLFNLAGLAVGNGLTDPRTQVGMATCHKKEERLRQSG